MLGIREQESYAANGGHVTILDAGRATLEINDPPYAEYIDEVEVGSRVAGHIRVAFEVEDTCTATDDLVDAGARLVAPPTVTPRDTPNSRLDGPAGLQLTLFGPAAEDVAPGLRQVVGRGVPLPGADRVCHLSSRTGDRRGSRVRMTAPLLVARVLWRRRRLRRHESWSRDQLRAHQESATAALRRFAYDRSPFYRQFHRGKEHAPLAELPVLTKAVLMDRFDEISSDRALRLADVQAYLEAQRGEELFRGRYWVAATSGSSGRRSIIPADAAEWATVIAGYARANEWAGVRAGLRHRTRMAVVSSTTSWHQSARVAASVRSPLVASERLDAAAPVADIVGRLNDVHPEVLIGYATMIRVLAEEQVVGRLRISPRAVNSSSEVLTGAARQLARRAWGVLPFDVYAATETGGIAAECSHHVGMHMMEDLVVPEVVDEDYRPVPDGHTGARLLVTVLFSRTLPLIRYELTDRVQLSTERCPCGRPFRLIAAIEGRTDDVLSLSGSDGRTVRVHPVAFHQVLDLVDAAGWQVRQDADGLSVLLASPGGDVDPSRIEGSVRAALRAAGATVPVVRARVVDSIPAGAAGKRPLVVAWHGDRADPGLPEPH